MTVAVVSVKSDRDDVIYASYGGNYISKLIAVALLLNTHIASHCCCCATAARTFGLQTCTHLVHCLHQNIAPSTNSAESHPLAT